MSNIFAGGTQNTSLPCSIAHSAVISEPLPFAASIINVPTLRPDKILFLLGKLGAFGGVAGKYSEMTTPFLAIIFFAL